MAASARKLVIIIAADEDAGRLLDRMVEAGHPATKISSTGGFLRHGSATILSGVDSAAVDEVLAMVSQPASSFDHADKWAGLVWTFQFPEPMSPHQPIPSELPLVSYRSG